MKSVIAVLLGLATLTSIEAVSIKKNELAESELLFCSVDENGS